MEPNLVRLCEADLWERRCLFLFIQSSSPFDAASCSFYLSTQPISQYLITPTNTGYALLAFVTQNPKSAFLRLLLAEYQRQFLSFCDKNDNFHGIYLGNVFIGFFTFVVHYLWTNRPAAKHKKHIYIMAIIRNCK